MKSRLNIYELQPSTSVDHRSKVPKTMIAKIAVLLFASACLAFPADEAPAPAPPQALPAQPPQGIPPPQGVPPSQGLPPQGNPEGQQLPGPLPDGPLPPQGTPGGKPENSDLKTDSSFWYRRTYYPAVYRRSYIPTTYTYSYYPSTYYSYSYPYTYYW